MPSPEPRFSKIAAGIGDPTRARMLAVLMGGQALAAGELAAAAGVGASTASAHIAKLLDAELIVARMQGRHRYLQLAGDDIAHALEALSLVAERSAHADKWSKGAYRPLKVARTCYRHIAGELGVSLFEGMLARGTLIARGSCCELSDAGRAEFEALDVPLPGASAADARGTTTVTRRFAHACFDWSERRDHLAGSLAVSLLDHSFARGWLRRIEGSRALQITPPGVQALGRWIGPQASA